MRACVLALVTHSGARLAVEATRTYAQSKWGGTTCARGRPSDRVHFGEAFPPKKVRCCTHKCHHRTRPAPKGLPVLKKPKKTVYSCARLDKWRPHGCHAEGPLPDTAAHGHASSFRTVITTGLGSVHERIACNIALVFRCPATLQNCSKWTESHARNMRRGG